MNLRILEITDMQAHLSLHRGFLKVSIKDNKEYEIPLYDIGGVIANSYSLTYSNNLLVKLAELNIPFIICGQNHSPVAFLWPVETHSLSAGKIDIQINTRKSFYEKIWKDIIQIKIYNQFICLKALNKDSGTLEFLIKKVSIGDRENIEAQAAKIYWNKLFGDNFIRDKNGDGVNSLLNYGYTILRSGIARSIMGAGLHPAIGIFHKNKYNIMRLADDLMEPFRPIVDYFAYKESMDGITELTPEVKKQLVNILYLDMDSPRGRSPVINRMQSLAYTYAYSLETLKKNLDLPILKLEDLQEINM